MSTDTSILGFGVGVVRCAHRPHCPASYVLQSLTRPYTAQQDAIKDARAAGWTVPGDGHAYCPTHRDETP
jgi:hypothetical protein